MTNKLWRKCPLENYRHYMVSDQGDIKNSNTGRYVGFDNERVELKNRELKIRRYVSIARLVALTYIPNPNGYKYVIHKSTDISDNRVCNLEWSNNRHEGGLRKQYKADADREFLEAFEIYKTIRELTEYLDVSRTYVYHRAKRLGIQLVYERNLDIPQRAKEAQAMRTSGMTTKEIADFYELSVDTIERWLKNGKV